MFLWSSRPQGQPQTWDCPLTSRPAQSTRTYSHAITPLPTPPCQLLDTWSFHSKIDSSLGLVALDMLNRMTLVSRKRIDDLPARVKDLIGREFAHHTRGIADTARTYHPTMPPTFDNTPLPVDFAFDFKEGRHDIPSSCIAIGMLYQLTSKHHELRSAGPALPRATALPHLMTTY
jgi:hypothetical protein